MNSKEDLERLRGFPSEQKARIDFQAERQRDVGAVFKARADWEKQKLQTLIEYKQEKAKQKARLNEQSPEYDQDLQSKAQWRGDLEEARQAHIQERNRRRLEERTSVSLSEEKELALFSERDRVDWTKRRFFSDTGKGGGRATRESSPPEFASPSPVPPPTDYFENDVPAPPPPPPMENLGPGGPGGFDDMPPPVFDDPEF